MQSFRRNFDFEICNKYYYALYGNFSFDAKKRNIFQFSIFDNAEWFGLKFGLVLHLELIRLIILCSLKYALYEAKF